MSAAEEPAPWQESAACLGVNPDVFFPEPISSVPGTRKRSWKTKGEYAQEAVAKSICAMCSVRRPCSDYADAWRIKEGIFGGEAGDERRKRWKAERRR